MRRRLVRPFASRSGGWLSRLVWRFQARHRPRVEYLGRITYYRGSPLKPAEERNTP